MADSTPAREPVQVTTWPLEAVAAVSEVLAAHFPQVHPGERRYAEDVLLGVTIPAHAVPRAEHERVVGELERLRQAIRDLADEYDGERFPGGLRKPESIAQAARLRQLVDGGQS